MDILRYALRRVGPLWRCSRITALTWRPRFDCIVPLRMPGIALDVQRSHLGVGDLDTLGIAVLIQLALHRQAGFGRRSGNQVDHRQAADERFSAPGLGDMAEHAVLSSRAEEFHPRALLEPYLKLSLHTAPDVRSLTRRNPQWAKRSGSPRTTRENHSRAPLGRRRRRLYLLRAQR